MSTKNLLIRFQIRKREKTKWKLQQLLFVFALGIHFCLRQRKICDCFCLHSFLFYPAHRPCGLKIFTQFKCTPLSYLWVVKLLRYFETSLSVTKCQNFSFQFNLTLSGNFSNFSFKRIFSLNFQANNFLCGPFLFFRLHIRKARDKLKQKYSRIHFTAS